MAIRNRRKNPLRRARRRAPLRGKKSAKAGKKPQYASITEAFEIAPLEPNKIYQNTFTLDSFVRASTLATNFRWYRATSVEYIYTPRYNTFQEDSTNANPQVPYMYTAMNRTQDSSLPGDPTLFPEYMLSQGSTPKKFVSTRTLKYKPNWCSGGLVYYQVASTNPLSTGTLAIGGLKAETAWVACPTSQGNPGIVSNSGIVLPAVPNILAGLTPPMNPAAVSTQSVMYNGHDVLIAQDNPVNVPNTPCCDVTCRVTWEFKGPSPVYKVLRQDPAVETAA